MRKHLGVKILCVFFTLYFIVAFFLQRNFPVRVVAGEESPGTWMSGALLVMGATISLIIGIREGWWPWSLLFIFFIVLALDERFMFHEQLKANIIFFYGRSTSPFSYELPVILAACMGVGVIYTLRQYVHGASRTGLVCAAVLGSLSVILDVLSIGIFFEECFKLLAELCIVCTLLHKVR